MLSHVGQLVDRDEKFLSSFTSHILLIALANSASQAPLDAFLGKLGKIIVEILPQG